MGTGCPPRATAPTRRWLARVGPSTVGLRLVCLDDDLYARPLLREAVQATGSNFIFVCKPSSRKMLGEYPHGVVPQEACQTAGRGSGKRHHRYRWMAGLPLRGGADALYVTWLEVEVAKPDGLDRRTMKPIISWRPFEKGR